MGAYASWMRWKRVEWNRCSERASVWEREKACARSTEEGSRKGHMACWDMLWRSLVKSVCPESRQERKLSYPLGHNECVLPWQGRLGWNGQLGKKGWAEVGWCLCCETNPLSVFEANLFLEQEHWLSADTEMCSCKRRSLFSAISYQFTIAIVLS